MELRELVANVFNEATLANTEYAKGKQDDAEHTLKRIHDVIVKTFGDPMGSGYLLDTEKEEEHEADEKESGQEPTEPVDPATE